MKIGLQKDRSFLKEEDDDDDDDHGDHEDDHDDDHKRILTLGAINSCAIYQEKRKEIFK